MVAEISAAAKLSDSAARQVHYDKINQLLKDYVMMIPVAHGGSGVAYQANVEGAHASPLGNELFSVMSNGTDTFVWMQNGEPASLWCSDETDGETLRACEQVYESLLAFEVGGTLVVPSLAESYTVNADLTEYTFVLRKGVKFHNGAMLDANDVVASFVARGMRQAEPCWPHRTFEFIRCFFGAFLNAPAEYFKLSFQVGLGTTPAITFVKEVMPCHNFSPRLLLLLPLTDRGILSNNSSSCASSPADHASPCWGERPQPAKAKLS